MNLSSNNSTFYFFYFFYIKKQLFESIKKLNTKIPIISIFNKRYVDNSEEVSEIESTNDWNFISRKVMSRDVIQILFDIMINFIRINEYVENNIIISKKSLSVKKNARYFGTVFSVSYFSDIVCANKIVHQEELIKLANILTKLIEKMLFSDSDTVNINLVKLSKLAVDYVNLFKKWSSLDKEYLVYLLAKKFLVNEIKLTAPLSQNEEVNEIYINAFNDEQTLIKHEVNYLGDSSLKIIFDELTSDVKNFEKIEKKLYWLDVDYSLQKENPDVITVLNLFKECKRLMKNLVLNREDLQNEIDNTIDESIISAVLEEKEIDQNFYFQKCEFILNWLGNMHSPVNDAILKNFKLEFQNKIHNNTYFYELIPFFFKFVLDSLENIHNEKEAFTQFIKDLKK